MEYIISLVLILFSALFSGLTLGLLSLDPYTLKRQQELGNKEAKLVYKVRKQGNLLLTTLLLGNVAVNAALSIFLGTIASGLIAGIMATALIFVFGEIIPQAVISRYALWFGARTAWLVRILMILFFPITFPIAFLLDRILGEELPTVYSKNELMKIITEHENSDASPIDADEERILHGALLFSHKQAKEVMTPLSKIFMLEESKVLDEKLREKIADSGYSRVPVYRRRKANIIGILYTKDILVEDEDTTIGEADEAFDFEFLRSKPDTNLDILLTRMLKQKLHMSIVVDERDRCIGVVTLEDIIEEIIQQEIEDEDD